MLCGSSFMSIVGRCKLVAEKMSNSKRFTRLKQNIKETTEEFLRSLDLLFDIAHDQATSLISHNSCQTKSMIAQFLEDQHSGRKIELGNMDKEYCIKVICQREKLQRYVYEKQHCRLPMAKTINGAACLMAMMATLKTLDCKTLNLMNDSDFRTSLGDGQLRHSTDT